MNEFMEASPAKEVIPESNADVAEEYDLDTYYHDEMIPGHYVILNQQDSFEEAYQWQTSLRDMATRHLLATAAEIIVTMYTYLTLKITLKRSRSWKKPGCWSCLRMLIH